MPQLDTTTFPSQLFWLGVCFLLLYFILSYLLVPRITDVLENREHVREQKINQASTYRERAENLLADYEKTLAHVRKDAHQKYQSIVNATGLEIAEKKKEMLDKLQERLHIAEQELYRARIEASQEMHSVAQEIAGEILQKLTGHRYPTDQLMVEKERE